MSQILCHYFATNNLYKQIAIHSFVSEKKHELVRNNFTTTTFDIQKLKISTENKNVDNLTPCRFHQAIDKL